MKVAVAGLWHLGAVTAACLASAGYEVIAFDGARETVAGLEAGRLPVAEPGLAELIKEGRAAGRLRLSSQPADLAGADVTWITYDTPVNEQGHADVESVVSAVAALLPFVGPGMLVLLSSQLPVGSTRRLEEMYRRQHPAGTATFACSPENLRLGTAIDAFRRPERVVVGIRDEADRARIAALFAPFTDRIEWMSVESAEMTKHALNAFLATSVAFANELAALCERMGADGWEVERGLKSDGRIGPRAYVRPGPAFAGGTLGRDVTFLVEMSRAARLPVHVLSAIHPSNDVHKQWARRRLAEIMGDVRGRPVAILGLTYKPGTDTLRGSGAVETSRWLGERGARVAAFDPAVRDLPADLTAVITLCASAQDALQGADAVLVATEWPEFAAISADDVVGWMRRPVVLDPARFLQTQLGADHRIRYVAIGRAA
jgi:UDPglucose 6-dehydrogenase